MSQLPRTSGDMIIDNIEYLSDLLGDMLSTVDRIRKTLPTRETLHDLSLSEDIYQAIEVNRVMADTATLVWSAEKTKDILTTVFADLSAEDA